MSAAPASKRRTRHAERRELGAWRSAIAAVSSGWCDAELQALPCKIMPWLLLGDAATASQLEVLRGCSVTHVLNVAGSGEGCHQVAVAAGAKYKQLNAQDREDYPILQMHWAEAWAFLREARDQDGVALVHCQGGVNRAGCVAAAALMVQERMPVVAAVQRCKAVRGTVLVNAGFQQELVRFAEAEGLLGELP